MQCSKCHTVNSADSFYCHNCGNKLKRQDKFDEYKEEISSLNSEKWSLRGKINSLEKTTQITKILVVSLAIGFVIAIIFAICFYIAGESNEKNLTQKITNLTNEKKIEIGLKNDTISGLRSLLQEKQKDIVSKHNEIVNLKSSLENKFPQKYKTIRWAELYYKDCNSDYKYFKCESPTKSPFFQNLF